MPTTGMTKPIRKLLEALAPHLTRAHKILEIGSLQIKNQKQLINLRSLFKSKNYIGIDIRKGPGVDKVINGEKLPFKKASFDLVLCLETLEHAKKPWLIAHEIQRVITDNGIIIISVPFNHPIHLHPSDYYRFTPYGLSILFNKIKNKIALGVSPAFDNEVHIHPRSVVLIGSKRNKTLVNTLKSLLNINASQLIHVHKPYRHRLYDCLKFIKRGVMELFYKEVIEQF